MRAWDLSPSTVSCRSHRYALPDGALFADDALTMSISAPRHSRLRLFSVALIALTAVFVVVNRSARAATQDDDLLHVIVLHTNDIHGQILPLPATWLVDKDPIPNTGGLERVGFYIERIRADAEAQGIPIFVFDGGDWFQGTPEGAIDKGARYIEAMQYVSWDAMVVGNHEFDHGVEMTHELLKDSKLPMVLANVTYPKGDRFPNTEPWRIVESGGLRVAAVGILSDHTPAMTHSSTRDLEWAGHTEALTQAMKDIEKWSKRKRKDIDLIIPITHIGIDEDRALARDFPDLPLIVGGHSHTVLKKGAREGNTRIVQAGSKGRSIGRVDLYLDPYTKEVKRSFATLLDLLDDPEGEYANPKLRAACAQLTKRTEEEFDKTVGTLTADLVRRGPNFSSTPAGNLVCDLMRARTGADVSFNNRGGIRASLEKGEVTRRDLFRVLPFDNALVTLQVSGADLMGIIKNGIERDGTGIEFSGVMVKVNLESGRAKITGVDVGGEGLDPERTYAITTNSFLADGASGFEALKDIKERQVDPVLQRDLFIEALEAGPVTPPTDDRYQVTGR
jgi:5'-nucleotidase / UDP-sugar diphosphatase